jgi:hypothetical protein
MDYEKSTLGERATRTAPTLVPAGSDLEHRRPIPSSIDDRLLRVPYHLLSSLSIEVSKVNLYPGLIN